MNYQHNPYQQPMRPMQPQASSAGQDGRHGTKDPKNTTLPYYGASFKIAVKRFFKNYVNFRGRASKSEFWWAQLFIFLLGLLPMTGVMAGYGVLISAAGGISNVLSGQTIPQNHVDPLFIGGAVIIIFISYLVSIVIYLALLLPTLSLYWRRLQDANIHGAFVFAIYGVNIVISVIVSSVQSAISVVDESSGMRYAIISIITTIPVMIIAMIPGFLPTKPAGVRFDPKPKPVVAMGGAYPAQPGAYPQPAYQQHAQGGYSGSGNGGHSSYGQQAQGQHASQRQYRYGEQGYGQRSQAGHPAQSGYSAQSGYNPGYNAQNGHAGQPSYGARPVTQNPPYDAPPHQNPYGS